MLCDQVSKNSDSPKDSPLLPLPDLYPTRTKQFHHIIPKDFQTSQAESPQLAEEEKAFFLFTVQNFRREAKARGQNSAFLILVILVLVGLTLFADRDFDALCCERTAERRALDHTWELLGRVDLEGFGVGPGENWALSTVQAGAGGWVADVDEVHLESERTVSIIFIA